MGGERFLILQVKISALNNRNKILNCFSAAAEENGGEDGSTASVCKCK